MVTYTRLPECITPLQRLGLECTSLPPAAVAIELYFSIMLSAIMTIMMMIADKQSGKHDSAHSSELKLLAASTL